MSSSQIAPSRSPGTTNRKRARSDRHELSISSAAMLDVDNQSLEDLRDEPPKTTLHIFRVVPMLVVFALLVHFLLPRIDAITDSLQTLRMMAPWAIALAMTM